MNDYNTAGPGSIITSAVAAIAMIAATALFLPPIHPGAEFGICLSYPGQWMSQIEGITINSALLAIAIIATFFLNKKYSFVKGADATLPVAMCILLVSNPVNTSCLSTSVPMLIINLICLDILMKSYGLQNATTQMFATATYLSIGSMLEYAFLPFIVAYPVMALRIKLLHWKELIAYFMGIVAPYWVAIGFGIVTFSDFRIPDFLSTVPTADGGYLLFIYISIGMMALLGIIMTLNNALLFYSGNIRMRTFNSLINILGLVSFICMLVDFANFEAYVSTFCFSSAVQIANFFAIRRIQHSTTWLWSILMIFIILFILMLF